MEKNRLAQLIAKLETRAIRAQMNPHFIFNCLNSIQECILADHTETACRYLSKFSRLLGMVLEESARNFHAIQHELELIRLYLELESMQFDQPMHYSIEVDPAIDTLNWQTPSLLLQPLVENAIWHGLIRCEADNNYTFFYLTGNRRFCASKTLKEFEIMLREHDFVRVHKSHLVNMQFVEQIERTGTVRLTNGTAILMSRRVRQTFFSKPG